jgi:hypothetical protein
MAWMFAVPLWLFVSSAVLVNFLSLVSIFTGTLTEDLAF